MTNIKISIIVPCYNQAQYLPESLQSVLEQTHENWECIIVNDGSPDNTDEIARNWIEKDTRFKYLEKENGGLSSARNFGINKAEGEWILPLDADDKISNNFLTEAVSIIQNNPSVKLIYPTVWLFGEENRIWRIKDYSYDAIIWYNMLVCSSMFKKEDFLKTKGYNESMKKGWEDWDFWLSFLKRDDLVIKLRSSFFYYRVKHTSMITELMKDKTPLYWQIFNNHIDIYQQQESYIGCMLRKRDLEEEINSIQQSKQYKLGCILLAPLFFIKQKVKNILK